MHRTSGRLKAEERTAWLFLSLFTLLFIIFKLYPLVYGVAISFLDRNSLKNVYSDKFVLFSNYLKVFSNKTTMQAFVRTFQFSAMYTVFTMTFSILAAILLNKEFRGRTATRTMFYMPYVTNLIAIGVVWNYILNPYKGPVNRLLLSLGIAEQNLPLWLSGNNSALPVADLIHTWVGLAFPVITLLAALQQVPRSLIEVADLEGAGPLQRLRFVILPSLKPAILFILTITIINSFKNYTVIMALTEGGPGTATQVASMQIYADAFKYFKLGIASAEGTLLALIIFIISSLIQRKTYEY